MKQLFNHTLLRWKAFNHFSLSPHRVSPFSRGVIFTRARVSLALQSLRKNGGLLLVHIGSSWEDKLGMHGFFIINMFLMIKKLSKLKSGKWWTRLASYPHYMETDLDEIIRRAEENGTGQYPETQERGFSELKSIKIPGGERVSAVLASIIFPDNFRCILHL